LVYSKGHQDTDDDDQELCDETGPRNLNAGRHFPEQLECEGGGEPLRAESRESSRREPVRSPWQVRLVEPTRKVLGVIDLEPGR
jgi:hypothetical protein